ncbi:MAG: serine hydrolase [Planctomycetota bacterium]|nr:serine hydrolase [Planctomycetota bacterium]
MKTILTLLLLLLFERTPFAEEAGVYFPPAEGVWEQADPAQAGWDTAKLKQALDYAGRQKSSAVVILSGGKLIAEKYWQPAAPEKTPDGSPNPYYYMRVGHNAQGQVIEDVASVQKSVTAMLVGIAQAKGLLKLNDPVQRHLGEGWSDAPAAAEAKITIRHLISMTSGLTTQLKYEAPAGSRWKYNTTAYAHARTCVVKAANMTENELTDKWLTGPLGMKDSRWVPRPFAGKTGSISNQYGFATTARDLARFGLLMLANGDWDGSAVLEDKEFIKAATKPSQNLNKTYGYLWWLSPGKGMYSAKGRLVRRLYVIPGQKLVIVRLGDQPKMDFDGEFLRLLRAAITK